MLPRRGALGQHAGRNAKASTALVELMQQCVPVFLVHGLHLADDVLADAMVAKVLLAVGGEISTSGALMKDMMQEVAENVTAVRIAKTAHWIVEENPEDFLTALMTFLET